MPNYRQYIVLNEIEFQSDPESYTASYAVRASRSDTQDEPQFQYDGLGAGVHTITAYCLTTQQPEINGGATTVGYTQLQRLKDIYNLSGASMPITFVPPTGLTEIVIPLGAFEPQLYQTTGTSRAPEFQVQLTLAGVSRPI